MTPLDWALAFCAVCMAVALLVIAFACLIEARKG